MGNLKNPETKKIYGLIIIIFLISITVMFIGSIYFSNKIKKDIVNFKSAIVGSILTKHPDFKDDIVKLTVNYQLDKENNVKKGKAILKSYGYKVDMNLQDEYNSKEIFLEFLSFSFGLILIVFLFIILTTKIILQKFYFEVGNITTFTDEFIKGNYDYELDNYSEGDVGVLKNNIVKMTFMLKEHLEKEKEVKMFLSETLQDISHQLKTPMTSIIMFNELMLDRTMEWKVREEFLKKSEEQLKKMEWLIKSLLRLSKLDAKVIDFKKEFVQVKDVIEESYENICHLAKNSNVLIKGEEKSSYIGDYNWSVEAITNIMKNSIEHTDYGGNIEIYYYDNPLFCEISIKDNGDGIDKKDIKNIFKRFYKGKKNNKSDSVGIGLALSKTIIENQNGSIQVKSEKGKGTEFIIRFLKAE